LDLTLAAEAQTPILPATSRAPWVDLRFTPRPPADPAAPGISCNRLSAVDYLVFLVYAAILTLAIHHHLPSDDEAQAWLLARDNPLFTLLFQRMHYEGGPGLWPIILWTAIRLHLPYAAVSWIGGTAALAGIFVWLRFSPLPRIFRWLLPFTFFLQYQYAVVARPYALFPLLLFALCVVYTLKQPRPILFALLAGLMANISLHAAMLASFFALLYLRELYWPPRNSTASFRVRPERRRVVLAVSLFLAFAIFSAVVAAPAPDVCTDGYVGDTTGKTYPWLRKLIPTQHLPSGAPPLDSFYYPDLLPIGSKQPDPNKHPNPLVLFLVRTIVVGGDAAFFPISESNLLAFAFLIAAWYWFRVKGRRDLLLPYFLTIILAVQIAVFDHHTGLLLLALVAAVWITLETSLPTSPLTGKQRFIAPAFTALALLVTLLQIGWTIHVVSSEAKHPYDAGLETERYLTQHFAGKRIAGFGYATVTTQSYATHSLFFNQPHAFWVWSAPIFINRRRTEALQQHPDVVVLEDFISRHGFFYNQFGWTYTNGEHAFHRHREFWEQHGYHVTHEFCGDRFMRFTETHSACELILEPNNPPAARN
jgi:hypothetical protein